MKLIYKKRVLEVFWDDYTLEIRVKDFGKNNIY